ncbi:MAG: YncE family protein [Steroidobacteraceae bacterium]
MAQTLDPNTAKPDNLWRINNPSGTAGMVAVDKVGGAVLFCDPITLSVLASAAVPGAHEMVISPDHRFGYVAQFGKWGRNAAGAGALLEAASLIWTFDLQTHAPIGRIDTFPNIGPHGMKFDNDGQLWVTFESNALGLVDTSKRALAGVWNLGEPMQPPRTMEINDAGTKLYCSGKGDDIIVFDCRSRKVCHRIALPGGATSLTATPDGHQLITFDKAKQDLLIINIDEDKIIARHPYKGAVLSNNKASRFVHARFSPDGRHFATCNYAGGTAHLHDVNNPAEHNIIPVAKGPQGLAFSHDCKSLYVANHDCGIMTIIDVKSAQPTSWLPAGAGIESFSFY